MVIEAGETATIPKEWTGKWDTEGYSKIWVIYTSEWIVQNDNNKEIEEIIVLDDSTTDVSIDLPDMDSYWMPFTGNRYFKENPRVIHKAEGMYCWSHDGRKLLDMVLQLKPQQF